MDYIRFADDRGGANLGWLDSKHTFSFGSYYDNRHMGVSALRVINDDSVAPGAGFGTHGHQDMEIISYVLEGQIEHKDSMGNHFIIPAGEVQRMSAGTGITHSEYNASQSDNLKFLQIWIQPKFTGIEPSYEQAAIVQEGAITPLITPEGENGALSINQDASISRVELQPGEKVSLTVPASRSGYLHIVKGSVNAQSSLLGQDGIGDIELSAGDGMGSNKARDIQLTASSPLEALWFDLP